MRARCAHRGSVARQVETKCTVTLGDKLCILNIDHSAIISVGSRAIIATTSHTTIRDRSKTAPLIDRNATPHIRCNAYIIQSQN